MPSTHLHILHLAANTDNDKVNKVATQRLKNLHVELEIQNITDYTIIEGFYDPKNTKQAIHKGHQRIVQLAKEQGLKECIISEDDIVFTSPNSYKYFLSQIPKSFDLFFGLIYNGEIQENRVMNGFSAGCSLYVVHNRFYETFLSQPIDSHVDRNLGRMCFNHEFYLCQPQVVIQRGGFSFNLMRDMFYWPYMEGKEFYGQEGKRCINGVWEIV